MNNTIKIINVELKKIIDQLGHFPTMKELTEIKRGDLLYLINKSGGINHFRSLLNYDLLQVPDGYYKDFSNVVKVINDYIAQENEFPTITALEKYKPGIKFAILKYHGGYRSVRDKLVVPQLMKENGHWRNFENVKKEILKIKDKIGVFPSVEDIRKYGPPGLYAGICIYHNGLLDIQMRMESQINYKSNIEKKVKRILDQYVIANEYIDNGKKKLYTKYGIKLIHPINKTYLELDRYYPEYKIAIEIQGIQHMEEVNYFSKQKNMAADEYLSYIQWIDAEKNLQCSNQGIRLISIDYTMSETEILNKIKDYLPLRSSPLKIVNPYFYDKKQIQKETLLKLEKDKGSQLTSNDIRKYSPKFYQDLLDDYVTLSMARSELDIAPLRESRDYWTLKIVIDKLSDISSKLGKYPTKSEICKIDRKLYYGIVKHGGLRKLKGMVFKA